MAADQPDIIQTILKDSRYRLDLFTDAEVAALRRRVEFRESRGRQIPYIQCLVREESIQLKPEEVVRQLYAAQLMGRYGYPKDRLVMEFPVNFGLETKRADIAVRDKDRPEYPYLIVECKSPRLSDGKAQLRSYCNGTGAPIGVWTNGRQISRYHRKDPNYFEEISEIPSHHQTLKDILKEHFTLRELILKDKVANDRKSLKDIILEMEDEVLANAGVDVFEEVFKLVFTKLYDEFSSSKDMDYLEREVRRAYRAGDIETGDHNPAGQEYDTYLKAVTAVDSGDFRAMEFRNTGQTDTELKAKIQDLFRQAMRQWPGVFPVNSDFELTDSHLAVCVSSLQDVKLFNSNLLVVDEAFEYLVNKSAKGEKGQFFTPRHVIDMCVQMLNPQRGEDMIDTAAGSCGFPVHTIFHVTGHLFTNAGITEEDKAAALRVFGIDFDEKTVRVARTLNMIAGDGQTNVLHLNTLDYENWKERTEQDPPWIRTYGAAFERIKERRVEREQNRRFNFDLLMANPPFAGDIKESHLLHQYEIALKNGKYRSKVGRDILFIERNLDFLKPGGRMAIVLPQGRFNNPTDKYIRDFIAERARILAVVGLHTNTFKPHTGTKTSVMFLQKWNDDPAAGPLCPRVDDYPVFMTVSERGGKDNSGNYRYLYAPDGSGSPRRDRNGHLIIDHDLHSHEGQLPPGIAEAFIRWAKNEGLSFWAAA